MHRYCAKFPVDLTAVVTTVKQVYPNESPRHISLVNDRNDRICVPHCVEQLLLEITKSHSKELFNDSNLESVWTLTLGHSSLPILLL